MLPHESRPEGSECKARKLVLQWDGARWTVKQATNWTEHRPGEAIEESDVQRLAQDPGLVLVLVEAKAKHPNRNPKGR